jgi:hypothetical protein
MRKILVAVMSAFLLLSSVSVVSAEEGGRVSMSQMKSKAKQHKVEHKKKIQVRHENFKAKKEAREAEMAKRQQEYEQRLAAEAAATQQQALMNGETTANEIAAPVENAEENIDTRPAEEIQAEIEQTLKELRNSVDSLQDEVNTEIKNAVDTPATDEAPAGE